MIEFIEPDVARARKCHGIFRLYGDLCAIDVCVEFESSHRDKILMELELTLGIVNLLLPSLIEVLL